MNMLTRPETNATLEHFYQLVQPSALGWRKFATTEELARPELRFHFLHWVLGFTLVYSTLFGVGNILFGRTALGLAMLTGAAACLALLFWSLQRRGWGSFR